MSATTDKERTVVAGPPESKAPPLGLRPRWIATQDRAQEIVNAMTRYNLAAKEYPDSWTEEPKVLNEWLEDEGYTTYAPYVP